MLKKASSGVPCLRRSASRRQVAFLPCSRTESTLRASNNGELQRDLASNSRPCWTDFFDHSPRLLTSISPRTFTCHRREKFNKPIMFVQPIFSILLASALALIFFTGCSEPSEWDRQWEAIQDHLHAGDLAQAQIQLQTILPSIREKCPSD